MLTIDAERHMPTQRAECHNRRRKRQNKNNGVKTVAKDIAGTLGNKRGEKIKLMVVTGGVHIGM